MRRRRHDPSWCVVRQPPIEASPGNLTVAAYATALREDRNIDWKRESDGTYKWHLLRLLTADEQPDGEQPEKPLPRNGFSAPESQVAHTQDGEQPGPEDSSDDQLVRAHAKET